MPTPPGRKSLLASWVPHEKSASQISTTPAPPPNSSPNVMRAALDRIGLADRKLFDRAADRAERRNSRLSTLDKSLFIVEPVEGLPFIGAWMHTHEKYAGLSNAELMQRQRMVQILTETRFASMQRIISFMVIFHAMGKRVQDFWPRVSFGLLGYDMAHSQSIMRVATTASPVAGMEVRDRMLAIRQETIRARAVTTVQRIWRSVLLARWLKQNSHTRKEVLVALHRMPAS